MSVLSIVKIKYDFKIDKEDLEKGKKKAKKEGLNYVCLDSTTYN